MNIDEAVSFFQEFLTAVYEQDVANLAEPDEQLEQRVAHTESFMHSSPGTSMTSPFMRPRGLSAEELAEIAQKAETPVRRPLYLVAEYDVPGWGTCFAAYLGGGDELTALGYSRQYWAMEIDGEPKVIALYTIDFYADGVGWENTAGAVIGNIGNPVAVRAFQEPRIPEYRQDYQRIVASAPQDGG
ncbi:hypothetical protein ACWDV4_23990 [Micromonospora sp. NPDC003197]